ncbi:ParB N-terminal domain-containing protein [Butyrivibrio sp. VCD2006]|uniref:ParB N-terminal domain-containing protein n=1 Tax=Butyrivibrio sp. VCD2006 TaxID=1280664 RepID=UPI0004096ECD|nr:ParB N-terminal domain-containing protein [Butyrivibrio sp. VCD2006]
MYRYSEDKDMYYYAGDLEEYLLEKGIPADHIMKMKAKIMEPNRDEYQIFPHYKSPKSNCELLVPMDKIIGTSRSTIGKSVFDNVMQMKAGQREPTRFTNDLGFLEKMPLAELKKSYASVDNLWDPIVAVHYVDDDAYYIQEGNHRTLTAMLIGAPEIRAKVKQVHCDEAKKEKYFYEKAFLEKYGIVSIHNRSIHYTITFNDGMRAYNILGFPAIEKNESMFQYIERLSAIIDDDRMVAMKASKLPKCLRKPFVEMMGRNYPRIKQYIEKTYADEPRILTYPNEEIRLLDL